MTSSMKASAKAHANIALVKYWGRSDKDLNIPFNDSVSMTKYGEEKGAQLASYTTIDFSSDYKHDTALIGKKLTEGREFERVLKVVNPLRKMAGTEKKFRMDSKNDFPTAAGLASSAAGFAALAIAASEALELGLTKCEMSTYARLGSGSAARSVHGGFVYWHKGVSHETSYAEQICGPDEFAMKAVIAIVSEKSKDVSSDAGHETAGTSLFNEKRIWKSQEQARDMKKAVLDDDFTKVGKMAEENCKYMHAVMMTSEPSLFYWMPATIDVIKTIEKARAEGAEYYYTIDAGPNVHCFCRPEKANEARKLLDGVKGVKRTIVAQPADDSRVVKEHLF